MNYPFGDQLFKKPNAPNFRYADYCGVCVHGGMDDVCERHSQYIGISNIEPTICDDYEERMGENGA
jgi:hypothetical protein